MPLTHEELEQHLQSGNVAAIQNSFKGATEAERKAAAPVAIKWCRRLTQNWRSGFNKKAAAEVKASGPIGNWHALMPTANAAALATASFSEIKSLEHHPQISPEAAVSILSDRRPVWVSPPRTRRFAVTRKMV